MSRAHKGQKVTWDLLELELQMVVSGQLNPSCLREQTVFLTTDPSLQQLSDSFLRIGQQLGTVNMALSKMEKTLNTGVEDGT